MDDHEHGDALQHHNQVVNLQILCQDHVLVLQQNGASTFFLDGASSY